MATTITHGAIPITACIAATILPGGVTPVTIGLAAVSSIYLAYHLMQ